MTTRDEKAIDDYFIKLSGKAALPKPLEIGHNYRIEIEGSITEKKEKDREDGGRVYTWIFEPVLVSVINEKGERIKAKDVRRISQRLRARCYVYWKNNQIEQDFEEWYQRIGEKMIINFDEIIGFVLK